MIVQNMAADQIRFDPRIALTTEAMRNELIDEAVESGDPDSIAAAFEAVAESRRRFDSARNAEVSRD